MQIKEKLDTLTRLHHLIDRRATGDSIELAKRLNVSKSTLFRYLNELRNFGAPIAFCMKERHYFYEQDFELRFIRPSNGPTQQHAVEIPLKTGKGFAV